MHTSDTLAFDGTHLNCSCMGNGGDAGRFLACNSSFCILSCFSRIHQIRSLVVVKTRKLSVSIVRVCPPWISSSAWTQNWTCYFKTKVSCTCVFGNENNQHAKINWCYNKEMRQMKNRKCFEHTCSVYEKWMKSTNCVHSLQSPINWLKKKDKLNK